MADRRNAIWSELLDGLNAIVGHLRDHPEPEPVRFRMADFASFSLKVATLWGRRQEVERALARLEGAQAELVLEAEPIHQVLELWLRDQANTGRVLDARTLHLEWSKLAAEHNIGWSFRNGKALGVALGQVRTALRESFNVLVAWDAHAKQNRYGFRPKPPEASPGIALRGDTLVVADPEEVPVLAGCAG
jgi:hypothetical protein